MNLKHGLCKHPEYNLWKKMRQRCFDTNAKDFQYYGGRGIKICKEWDNFANFYKDMGPRPTSKHELDRINNNGNYEPNNCRWTTRQIQCINKRVLVPKTSKLRYVSKHPCGKWQSSVKRNQKSFYIGLFKSEKDAHNAALNFLGAQNV